MAAGGRAGKHGRAGTAWRDLVEGVVGALEDYYEDLMAAGYRLDEVAGVEEVAGLVRRVLPRPNRFAERVGAVYTTGPLRRLLAGPGHEITGEAIRQRHAAGNLVGFKTADGRWAWPAFQFRAAPGRLAVRRDVLALWRLLPYKELDGLLLVSWLTGRRDDLDGETPLAWLERHGLDERLRTAAGEVRRRAAA